MESKLLDVKIMEADLLQADEGYVFYCNNCNYEFTFVHRFNPVPGLSSYYTCSNCNAILPTKDLKKKRLFSCLLYYLSCGIYKINQIN